MTAAGAARLGELQRWMQAVLLHPHGVAAGLRDAATREHMDAKLRDATPKDAKPRDAAAVLCDLPEVAAADTLRIYARMIRRRFCECLEVDHPALRDHLGADAFDELARAYVAATPSRHWSLNRYSLAFADFVRRRLGGGFAADLADLERALALVRLEADAPALSVDDLLAAAGRDEGALRLELVPAARLLAPEHPVEPWYRAWRRGQTLAAPAPEPSFVLVYRNAGGLWRLPLSLEQHVLLRALAAGSSLEDALDQAASAPGADPETLASGLSDWFREWGGEGLFRGL